MRVESRLFNKMKADRVLKQKTGFWPKKASELARFLNLEIYSQVEVDIDGVAIDSREINPENLFVCIKGLNADGHDFIEKAYRKGVSSFLIDKEKLTEIRGRIGRRILKEVALLFSSELKPQEVLESFAKKRYIDFKGEVIGITGSSGKTTTRELISHLLSKRYKILCAYRNLNTEIGLSLVIVNSRGDEDIWVLEYGARNRGDIARLVGIAAPDKAVITNIGYAHLGIMGSREEIYKEKTTIMNTTRCQEAFIFNEDDYTPKIMRDFQDKTITKVGFKAGSDMLISDLSLNKEGNASMNLEFRNEKASVSSKLRGKHNVINASLAAAVAVASGISLKEVANSLKDFELPKMRFEVMEFKGLKVINDAYNANPVSMRSALETFSAIETIEGRKRIAVLGDMLELGKRAPEFHREIGVIAGRLGIDAIVYVGEMGKFVEEGYRKENRSGQFVITVDKQKAAQELMKIAESGDAVLLKASRAIALEKVLSYV